MADIYNPIKKDIGYDELSNGSIQVIIFEPETDRHICVVQAPTIEEVDEIADRIVLLWNMYLDKF